MSHTNHIRLCIAPFENYSPLPVPNIFCRSFSADLLSELSRFRQFWIAACPENDQSLEFIRPDYAIRGNFSLDEHMVKINVQLYHFPTGQMLWGNRFEGRLSQLNDLQENLLLEVVGALQHEINADLLSKMRRRQRVDFKAYEYWLHGMEELKKGSVEADERARGYFEQALTIQPDYALACTGMSLTYFNEWSCQLWDRWEVAKSGAFEWAQKAIELDDRNYIASMVLGKIFLYSGAYETAEYYFRQSLTLNQNDPETLIPMACYMVYLGLTGESETLYNRALKINPAGVGKYHFYGAFIFFETGEFSKAVNMITRPTSIKWADAEVYFAATYYYLQQYKEMKHFWEAFLLTYDRLIAKGRPFTIKEVVGWIREINPHKYSNNNLEGFLLFLENKEECKPFEQPEKTQELPLQTQYFYKEGSTWRLGYEGREVVLPEVKGFFDLSKLLSIPKQVFHCAELMGSVLDEKGDIVFDQKAKTQYEKRIMSLQKSMQEAEKGQLFDTLEKLQDEYDSIIDHLSKSLGLKGRIRETGSPVEKARAAVTWRIRHAIARIEGHHPLLGAHLSNAIKTGTFCSYQPEREMSWMVMNMEGRRSLTM